MNTTLWNIFAQISNRARGNLVKNGTVQTKIGLIFGDRKAMDSLGVRSSPEIDHGAVKNILLKRAKQLFTFFEEDSMQKFDLSLDMIDVDFKENNAAKASVTCVYCKHKSKVYFKLASSGCYVWVLSNLKTHISYCLKRRNNPENTNEFYESSTQRFDTDDENLHQTTIDLKIEPSFCERTDAHADLENILFTQIKVQII